GEEDIAVEERVLTIGVFEGGFGRDFWDDLVARFEAANPGVTVDMTISPDIEMLMAPRIAVGDVPDFLSVNMDQGVFIAMRTASEFTDLTDFFQNTEVLDRPGTMIHEIIIPGMLDSPRFSPDGYVMYAPFNAGPMGMVYNQTLFDEMGWTVPATWDELFAMDELLDDPDTFVDIGGTMERRSIFTYQGIHPGYLESILWPSMASVIGIDGLAAISNYEEGAWDNPEVYQVVSTLARLGVEGYLMEGTVAMDHTTTQAMMMMGRALFIPNGLWMVSEMEDAPREDGFVFAMAPPPAMAAGQTRYVMSSSEQMAIPRAAREPELAKEFLRFMYTNESIARFAQLAGGNIAVIDAPSIIAPYIDPNVANMLRAYELGSFMLHGWGAVPEGVEVVPVQEVFTHNMSPLMTGVMSVQEYIDRQEEVAAIVRDAQ
ncbi:MAG: extracellular solute-binding protein, partial [Firmicutes bacterium]|nr:extracellular solute-binding protein [Bacillota bacterium]